MFPFCPYEQGKRDGSFLNVAIARAWREGSESDELKTGIVRWISLRVAPGSTGSFSFTVHESSVARGPEARRSRNVAILMSMSIMRPCAEAS
jgi:hypothetical protein